MARNKGKAEENPENLPVWSAPEVPSVPKDDTEGSAFDNEEFDVLFHEVIDPRFGPDESEALTSQANGIMRVAQLLAYTRRQVDHYIGELASVVEDFGIWQYYPGCQSVNEFWNLTGLSQSVIKNAIQLHRHGAPVARQVGVNLAEHSRNGELTGKQAQAITAIGRDATKNGKLATIEGQQQVRTQIESVLAAPTDGEVFAMMRDIKGKPERTPCFLEGEVVSDEFEGPKVRLSGELTPEQADAAEMGALYFVVKLGGRVVEFREVSQVLRDATVTPVFPLSSDQDDDAIIDLF